MSATGRSKWMSARMSRPDSGCCTIRRNSAGLSEPGRGQDLRGDGDLADVVHRRRDAQALDHLVGQLELGRDGDRQLDHAALVPAV